jgi:hypothetical protein
MRIITSLVLALAFTGCVDDGTGDDSQSPVPPQGDGTETEQADVSDEVSLGEVAPSPDPDPTPCAGHRNTDGSCH